MNTTQQPAADEKSLYELFETDPKLEMEGVGFKFGPATFFCKRAGGANREFDTKFNEATKNMSTRLQMQALSDEQSEEILRQVFAESVMIGWENVRNRKMEQIPYTKENFVKVMKDLPEVWKSLCQQATNMEAFLIGTTREDGE